MTKPTNFDEALALLSKPIPKKFVKAKPKKGSPEYVPHHVIRQYLHAAFDDHTFETVDVRQQEVTKKRKDGTEYEALKVAMKVALHVHLNGEVRTYFGWGESDNDDFPFKSAESDAVKRIAAMSFGLGLNLWSREHYFLPAALAKALEDAADETPEEAEYGGDGDEDVTTDEQPATDEVAAKRDAKADPPAPSTDDKLAAKFRVRFHAVLSDLSVPDEHKKIWLAHFYDGITSTNDLTDGAKRALLKVLDEDGGRVKLLKAVKAALDASDTDVDTTAYAETIETLSAA